MSIGHILLAEDDPHDAELTLAALEAEISGKEIVLVRDGEEALDYLYCRGEFETREGGNPIVALLDFKMPKMNGLEVLKIIKTDEALKIVPVVMLSSSRRVGDLTECYKHGVNAYVVKPVDFGEFGRSVKQLGVFWASINEPPPERTRPHASATTSAELRIGGRN